MASLRAIIGCALVSLCGACFDPEDPSSTGTDTDAEATASTMSSDPSASSSSPTSSDPTTDPTSGPTTSPTTGPTSSPTTTDDSSGDETPPPDCPARTHQCVDAADEGWSGPVAVYRGDVDSPAPACAFPYPVPDAEVSADLDVPMATCDCECEPPADATCDGASVVYNGTSATCDAPSTTYFFPANGCADFGNVEYFSIRFWELDASTLQVIGSDCTAQATEDIPPATHASIVVACGGVENDGDCGNEQLCVPDPEDPFSGSLCIWQAGDVECPAGSAYSERSVYYESVSDERDCPTCACGPLGGTCDDVVATLRDDPNCGGAGTTLTPAAPCTSGGTVSPMSAEIDFTVEPSCTPNGGGDPVGDVTESGPHTFCCTP